MAKSLLAHLYPRISGSQEDIATISLQYLISQSEELNREFTRLLSSSLHVELGEQLQYSCQVTGDENERPDMAGYDGRGNEVVLCEMKFYAGLTTNQPITYLERLRKTSNSGESGCVFICPKSRETNLWARLKELCAEEQVDEIDKRCISVNGVHLSIITWAEVITSLRTVAAHSAMEYQSDIEQLDGYCAQMDSDAFIPFRAEDLNAGTAKNIRRYYDVIDETFDLICADKKVKVFREGKASTYIGGYQRKLKINGLLVYLMCDLWLWESRYSIETPFWISIEDWEWQQSEFYQRQIAKIPSSKQDQSTSSGVHFLALESLQNATLDEVCQDLKRQIFEYVKLFQKADSK